MKFTKQKDNFQMNFKSLLFSITICVFLIASSLSAKTDKNFFYKKYRYSLSLYKKLKTKRVRNKRKFSTKVIQNFYFIYNSSNNKKLKAKSLFLIGRTYYYLAKYYQSEVFTDLSIGSFYRLGKEFRHSTLVDDAKYYSAELFYYYKNLPSLAVEQLNEILRYYPKGDFRKRAKKFLHIIRKKHPALFKKNKKALFVIPKNYSTLKRIRTFGLKNFSRIAIDLKGKPKFIIKRNSTDRTVTIKLFKTVKGKNFKIISLNSNSIDEKLTVSTNKKYILITFNSWKIKSLHYFTLKNPDRLVVDIEETQTGTFLVPHETISTIILDAGHGGKDPGARYYGLNEKDVVLKIAKYTKYYLQKTLNARKYRILLTRDSDVFLPLEDRASFANDNNADLFISIHCNATPDRRVYGLETYYLDIDKNNPFIKKVNGEVNTILEDLIRNSKLEESIELAKYIQKTMINNLKRRYTHIHNLGIKEAPFYVLFGTRMPSVLVETSFISNKRENRRLRNKYYIKLLSKSIAQGIASYIRSQKFVR